MYYTVERAVSYTHLDVYKRQHEQLSGKGAWGYAPVQYNPAGGEGALFFI